jgi:hypothetical protein
MKATAVKYVFLYLSAIYFFVAGAGYNVVSYCCLSCENEGIEMIAVDSCFDIHHHTHTNNSQKQHGDLFCADFNQHVDSCQFVRLNTDIPSFQTTYKLHLQQICTVHLFDFADNSFLRKIVVTERNNISSPDNLLLKSGRSILTFNAILLI